MKDYWLDQSCLTMFVNHADRSYSRYTQKRYDFLKRFHPGRGQNPFPFMHNILNIKDPWINKDLADPLVVPLLRHLNNKMGIRTIWSCQGSAETSPIIGFTGNADVAFAVKGLFDQWHREEGWFWNDAIVMLDCRRIIGQTTQRTSAEEGDLIDSWCLFLYDPLTLISFTRDYLGVSIHDQLNPPEMEEAHLRTCVPQDVLDDPEIFAEFLDWQRKIREGSPTVEEIEEVLKYDWKAYMKET